MCFFVHYTAVRSASFDICVFHFSRRRFVSHSFSGFGHHQRILQQLQRCSQRALDQIVHNQGQHLHKRTTREQHKDN